MHNPSAPIVQNVSSPPAEIDLRVLFLMMWRRRYVFVSFILAGMALAFAAVAVIPPQYTARAIILIDPGASQNPMDKVSIALGTAKFDSSVIMNELEILRSGTMVRRVIKRLDLMTDPEFNSRFSAMESDDDKSTSFRKFSVYNEELGVLPSEAVNEDMDRVGEYFLDHLRARSISGSYAMQVEFTSRNPRKAALIANKISDMYIEQRFDHKYKAAEKLTETLDMRLDDLRTQLRTAEEKVERYRAAHNLLEGQKATFSQEQLSELNRQLIQAKTEHAQAQARLQQIKDLDGDYASLEALAAVDSSSLVRQFKSEQAQLEAEISQLSSRYGERHPEMINRRLKIAELRRSLRAEVGNLGKTAQADIDFSAARIAVLDDEISNVTDQIYTNNSAMIGLRELEREAGVARHVFDVFLESYKRSGEQQKLQEAQARVISYATVPRMPSFPSKGLIYALAGLLSLLLALIAAVIVEKLDNSYRSGTEMERSLGFACYGLVPALRGVSKAAVGDYVLERPTSSVAEAVRTLRMVLNLRAADGATPKVVTLSSSLSGEGKTTLSLWLGRMAAKSGEKVLILDSDLRHPKLHEAAGADNAASLVDYLYGDKTLPEVIYKDDISGADMVFGRDAAHSALDMIGSRKLSTLIDSLREMYDLVIIDTPACLEVSDARLMAALSDHVLYIVAWNKTRRESVASGVKKFTDMNYQNLSFVLTHVNLRKHLRYGYGDISDVPKYIK